MCRQISGEILQLEWHSRSHLCLRPGSSTALEKSKNRTNSPRLIFEIPTIFGSNIIGRLPRLWNYLIFPRTHAWDRRTITVPPEAVAREFRGGKAGQRGSRVEKKREIRGKINGMLTVTRRPRKQARDHLEDQRRDGQGMSYHPVNLIIRVRVFQDAQDFHAPRPIMPRVLSTIPV